MMKKRTQQVFLATLATKRITHRLSQCVNILRNEVGQVHIFAVIPNLLDRVEVRGISWQPFEIQLAEPQSEFLCRRTVNHPAVDNQDEPSGKMPSQLRHKLLKVIRVHIRILYRKIKSKLVSPRRNTYCRNSRQPVATIPAIVDWSPAFGRPGAPNRWLKHEAAFVRQYDRSAASMGFFLSSASPSFARGQWPFHRVPWLDVPASGNSSPCLSEYARHWTIRSGCQSVFRLLRPLDAKSRVPWHTHCGEHPLTEASPANLFAYLTNCCVGQEGCALRRRVHRAGHGMSANSIRLMGLPLLTVLSRGHPALVPAMRWLYAVAAPIVWVFLQVSYP